MKSLRFKITTILLISIVMGMVAREMASKQYHEQYATDTETRFNITNRYGKIDIINTTNDEMTIDVVVKVEASSEAKAQDIIDDIHITLKKEGDVIVALTEIGNRRWGSNVNFQIDYTIMMPSYINTDLRCHYGDVTIAEITGQFAGVVKYGSLTANALTYSGDQSTNTIDLAYCGRSAINSFSAMSLKIGYSKVRLGTGDVVVFSSKYSDLKVKDIALIKGSITYGDIDINSALNVEIEGKYSDISAGVVHGSLIVNTKYGDLEVDQLSSSFSNVDVEAGYSDVDIVVNPKAAYSLYAKASYGDLDHPSMQVKSRDDEGSSVFVDGYVGRESSDSKIKVITSYGDIDIKTY